MNRGWWTLGKFRGAPIRAHWSLPLGAFAWGHFAFVPAYWLGFALLILLHELGHALLVVRYGLGLSEIALHGVGGYCQHERAGSRFEAAAVAWGGVLAQLAAFVAVQGVVLVAGPPTTRSAALFVDVFTRTNLWLIFINLIPIEPLDGRKAWPLFGMLLARARNARASGSAFTRRPSVQDELRALERLDTRADPRGETPSQKTDRIVRELIERTTQSKNR